MAGETIVGVMPAGLAPPGGHYAHAVVAGDWVFVSGQLPVTPEGTRLTGAPFEAQVQQVLANLDAALRGAGTTRQRLVQVRVYVTDIADWPVFDALYAAWLGPHRPARAVVPVPMLHHGLRVELEATARL